MPSLVIFVVKVETAFYEKFVAYISALNNGSLRMIKKERFVMNRTLLLELFFVYEVQLILAIVLCCLASLFFPYLDASLHMLHIFVLLSLGIYVVFCMYFTVTMLYYFADYRSTCISLLVFLTATGLGVAAAILSGAVYVMALPLLAGGFCGWCVSFALLCHRMRELERFLLC